MVRRFFYLYFLPGIFVLHAKAQVEPAPYGPGTMVNSITIFEATTPETSWPGMLGKAPLQTKQTTQFLDGWGRPIQTVRKQGSPLGNDMVAAMTYDELGRKPNNFLPFVSTQTVGGSEVINNGEFKLNPFQQQKAFYQSLLAGQNETYLYSQIEFETSPLNRPTKSMRPGGSWVQNGTGSSAGYDYNKAEEKVHIWDLAPGALIPSTSSIGVYPDSKLYKLMQADENQKKTITYADQNGNVILKKVQEKEGVDVTVEHAGWACTYYVYDDYQRLRFIIPPKAVAYLDTHGWSLVTTMVNSLCFIFEYDVRDRVIMKKQPGVREEYLVYDAKDRVVLRQNAQLNRFKNTALSQSKWVFNLYNEKDQIVASGLLDNDRSRENIQLDVDNLTITDLVSISAFVGNGTNQSLTVNCPVAGYSTTDTYLSNSNIVYNQVIHFDNYNYTGAKPFNTGYHFAINSTDYIEPTEKNSRLWGFVTGTKVRVMDNDNNNSNDKFIFTTIYYDDKARVIQTLTDNIKGGVDHVTHQYDFSGKLLSSYSSHSNGSTAISVVSKKEYDKDGRLKRLSKNFNNSLYKQLAEYTYNELGKLKIKRVAPGYTGSGKNEMESQTFSYNIHGSLTGINKDYAISSNDFGQWDNYFGLYLGYDNRDNRFSNGQLTGNITGLMWRSQGDNAVRRYDYTYDNLGRIATGLFLQKKKPSVGWANNELDLSIYAEYEDANGNLRSLRQMGVTPGTTGIKVMDDLKYYYQDVASVSGLTGNLLKRVTDDAHTMADKNGILGDFKDGPNNAATDDYDYDASGNLVRDLNKGIQQNGIVYNYLNKPTTITIANKSTVEFVYDATGGKISKKVTQLSSMQSKTTYYIDGFIYEGNDLQYILHEEGRIKIITPVNSNTVNTGIETNAGTTGISLPDGKQGVFEYFLKDHLGSTRVVLTEEVQKEFYRAYMETANAGTEEQLFGKIIINSNNTVSIPPDNELQRARTNNSQVSTPWPNNSTDFVNLSAATGKTTGPNMVLKVMAGDLINATARYYYRQNNSTSGTSTPLTAAVTSLVSALTGSNGSAVGKALSTDVYSNLNASGGDFATFISNTQPSSGNADAPKAYLNIVFLDEQFKFIPTDGISGVGSHVQRVSIANADASFSPLMQKAPKNGWVYIYLSNESTEPVYFDDFFVSQEHGRISEEAHYYPYGMKIAGISARAFNKLANKFGYQGSYSEEEEESGYQEFYYRMYDPQIGRWNQADPYDQFASPYLGMGNDPVNNNDPTGGLVPSNPWDLIPSFSHSLLNGSLLTTGLDYIFGKKEPGPKTGFPMLIASRGQLGGEDATHGTNGNPGELDLDDLPEKTDGELFEDMYDLFEFYSSGSMEPVARAFVDRFRTNQSGNYSNVYLEDQARRTGTYSSFLANQTWIFKSELKRRKGLIDDFRVNILTMPVFDRKFDGTGIIVHGVQKVEIYLNDYNIDRKGNYKATLGIKFYDDFGLSLGDVTAFEDLLFYKDAPYMDGLKAWWMLQHQRNFRPFVTVMTFTEEIQGNINDK